MKASSCIGKSHEIMSELRMNAFNQIGHGHKAIHIISLSNIGQGQEVIPKLRINAPNCIGQGHKVISKLRTHWYSQLYLAGP